MDFNMDNGPYKGNKPYSANKHLQSSLDKVNESYEANNLQDDL